MTAALHSTFQAVRGAILTISADEADRLATAWRISQQEVRDSLRSIQTYQQIIAERDDMLTATIRLHKPADIELAERRLPWALSVYLGHVRIISETEHEMTKRGIRFAASSDHWSEL